MTDGLLVSCIMPTFNRRRFIPRALACFFAQTYPHRELVVLDDGDDAVEDLMPSDDRVRYVRLPSRQCVGKKRNMACRQARGQLVAHFDDDDWYAPERLELQVAALNDARFDLCGVDRLLYYDVTRQQAYEYRATGISWLSLLCYRRTLWEQKPFPEVQVASDTLFLQRIAQGRKTALRREGLSVCTIHGKNVSPKRVHAREWRTISPQMIREAMGKDFGLLTNPEAAAISSTPARTTAPTDGADPAPDVETKADLSAGPRPEPKTSVRDLAAGEPSGSGDGSPPVSVGILSVADPRKGLFRDTECLVWALSGAPLRHHGGRSSTSVFAVDEFRSLYQGCFDAVRPSRQGSLPSDLLAEGRFDVWLDTLDVLVVAEVMVPTVFDAAHARGVRVVYIPNLDWAQREGQVQAWTAALRDRAWIQIWAKSPQIKQRLQGAGVPSVEVPWSIPDGVATDRDARASERIRLLFNGGQGGWQKRRAIDLGLRAFAIAKKQCPELELHLKINRPLSEICPGNWPLHGVRVETEFVPRPALESIYDQADAVLHVSRWEGFGLPLLEALHRGLPVIATDGWPMNELVEHEHNGLLVTARRVGDMRLAPHWEVNVSALATAMVRFARDAKLRARLTCPEPGALRARQYKFRMAVRRYLLDEPPPRVVMFRSRLSQGQRSAHEFWSDALAAHGYDVARLTYEATEAQIEAALSTPHDLVLLGKGPVGLVRNLHRRRQGCSKPRPPLVLWHHDLIEFTPERRRWFHEVAKLVDVAFIPDAASRPGLRTKTLLSAAMTSGDRGPGRRPCRRSGADEGPPAVFIGGVVQRDDRLPIITTLVRSVGLQIVGDPGSWKGLAGLHARPPVYNADADALHRAAQVSLSISRGPDTPGYSSVRLFNAAGAGACIALREFPGRRTLFPDAAVAPFEDPAGATRVVRTLLADPALRERMRTAAETHVWRHHTWNDRVHQLMQEIAPREDRTETMTRINLGCGQDIRPGYINVDARALPGVDVRADLCARFPFEDRSADEVLALDVLEHFPRKVLVDHVLPEIRRILRPGGVLKARLPDFEQIVRQWQSGGCDDETTAVRLHGRQDYEGNLHYFSYTERTMSAQLRAAGFDEVKRSGTVNWNMELEARLSPASVATVSPRPSSRAASAPASSPRSTAFWDRRARTRGERAVGHVAWTAAQFSRTTDAWWRLLSPHLRRLLPPPPNLPVLDFGCGAGRFTQRLASTRYPVDAIDISQEMLRLAQTRAPSGARFHHVEPGRPLPFDAGHFSGLWAVTVLQHVPDGAFESLCDDLRRVLAPDAALVLFENTDARRVRTSRSGHMVFRPAEEYTRALPGLAVVHQTAIEGEEHTVFAGRLS